MTLDERIDRIDQKVDALATDMAVVKHAVMSNGGPGLFERVMHIESRQDKHDGVIAFWRWGIPVLFTLLGLLLAGLKLAG